MEVLKELLNEFGFTYENGQFKSTITGQEIPITKEFNVYINGLREPDIAKLKQSLESMRDKLTNLLKKNQTLFDIIDSIKNQCKNEEVNKNFDTLLKQLHLLELKIVLYICQKVKDTKNRELLDKLFTALTPKLESLNKFYDQKLQLQTKNIQTGGSRFMNEVNILYKTIKYKGKCIARNI